MKLGMILVFSLLVIGLGAFTINVPDDYVTIQEAIEASVNGDSVLVAPGIYYENLFFNMKSIYLCSWYITAQDTSYISQTIIDGGHNGNVISMYLECRLAGFTIRNGYDDSNWGGAGVYCEGPYEKYLEALVIENNVADDDGGGLYNNSLVYMAGVTIRYNTAGSRGGGLYCGNGGSVIFSTENLCNIYDNNVNDHVNGNDIYSQAEMNVIVDTFSVLEPTMYHAYPIVNFTFDIQQGVHAQVEDNVYVSPAGDNSNSGCSSDQPVQTIRFASSILQADSLHIGTIHLLPGIYSASVNNETFPIILPDYMNLSGESEAEVILDAESNSSVMLIDGEGITQVINLTMINAESGYGGGILNYSEAGMYLENVTIRDNYASLNGGGINCYSGSQSVLQNVTITNNSSQRAGGIYCCGANLEMYNCTVSYNLAIDDEDGNGGGINLYSSNAILENVIIDNNYAAENGGGIYSSCDPEYWSGCYLEMQDVFVTNNICLGNGGGIYGDNETVIESENIIIQDNFATGNGGGMYCSESELSFLGGRIISNSAYNGGGLQIIVSDTFFRNVLISDNTAGNNGAGLYLYNNFDLTMQNTCLANNIAITNGGGIFCHHDVSITSINSILWGNLPHQLYSYQVGSPNLIIMGYSDLEEAEEGLVINDNDTVVWLDGNIDELPLFTDPAAGNYLLQQNSPCIDAGIAHYEYNYIELIDLDDDEYWGIAPDMGAFEYGVVNTEEFKIENVKLKIENYPNPFNPETRIVFNLPEAGKTQIAVYNLKGQLVKTLADDVLLVGENFLIWDGRNEMDRIVSSGIYLVRMQCNKEIVSKKIMLMK
ncbi:MAG: T9SS type A sorting domain-containing protein [Candidatus Cloacimonetes bacterium]|nr:T9SS type A sorting domain-containing protein [Candidatus Cloacimonadota bacterium]